ncbi:TPA: immunoglobulin-like domain-containing protein [Enterococcus faecalis]
MSRGGTFQNGTFTLYAYGRFGKEDKVEIVGLDKEDKELDRKTVTITS